MQAEQLECVINSVYVTDQWYAEVTKMLWNAAMYGAGFLKVGWDQGLEDGLGQVVLQVHLAVVPLHRPVRRLAGRRAIHHRGSHDVRGRDRAPLSRRLHSPRSATALTSGDVSKDHVPPTQEQNVPKQGYLIPIDAGQGPTTWGPPGGTQQP